MKKQPTVALSTAEAEWVAVSECVKEVKWVVQLMGELDIKVQTPPIIYEDNQSTIKICENDVMHDRMKHVDIRYHFVRDDVQQKKIKMEWVATQDQLADIFTKSLGSVAFNRIRDQLMARQQTNDEKRKD